MPSHVPSNVAKILALSSSSLVFVSITATCFSCWSVCVKLVDTCLVCAEGDGGVIVLFGGEGAEVVERLSATSLVVVVLKCASMIDNGSSSKPSVSRSASVDRLSSSALSSSIIVSSPNESTLGGKKSIVGNKAAAVLGVEAVEEVILLNGVVLWFKLIPKSTWSSAVLLLDWVDSLATVLSNVAFLSKSPIHMDASCRKADKISCSASMDDSYPECFIFPSAGWPSMIKLECKRLSISSLSFALASSLWSTLNKQKYICISRLMKWLKLI